MLFKSHLILGAAAGALACSIPYDAIVFVPVAMAASWLPDLDHKSSIGSSMLYPVSILFYKTCIHRGATHSILFTVILGLLVNHFFGRLWIPVVAGYSSHILGDFMTKRGCKILFPYNKFFGIPLITTNARAEKILVYIIIYISFFAKIFLT